MAFKSRNWFAVMWPAVNKFAFRVISDDGRAVIPGNDCGSL